MKTRNEVDELKREWIFDPCWDLVDTEGFEEYKEELSDFRYKKEVLWEQQREELRQERIKEIEIRAEKLDCSVSLVKYIITLERQLDTFQNRLDRLSY